MGFFCKTKRRQGAQASQIIGSKQDLMSGIYIHIPFCKQACHYCDFHFSTQLGKKEEMLAALQKELFLRKDEYDQTTVETIYFGGGTPSVLSTQEIDTLIQTVFNNYRVSAHPEITLEANPDDLSPAKIIALAASRVNRLRSHLRNSRDVYPTLARKHK